MSVTSAATSAATSAVTELAQYNVTIATLSNDDDSTPASNVSTTPATLIKNIEEDWEKLDTEQFVV